VGHRNRRLPRCTCRLGELGLSRSVSHQRGGISQRQTLCHWAGVLDMGCLIRERLVGPDRERGVGPISTANMGQIRASLTRPSGSPGPSGDRREISRGCAGRPDLPAGLRCLLPLPGIRGDAVLPGVRVRTRGAARRLDLTSMALSAGPPGAGARPHDERVTCLPLGAMVSRWRTRSQTLAVERLSTFTPKAGRCQYPRTRKLWRGECPHP
jgi:hypothetical protein